ncbi:MAG: flagellar biosynthesis anti-sigma factor FlgM [Candidatus Sulfotelmatobacter sp.]
MRIDSNQSGQTVSESNQPAASAQRAGSSTFPESGRLGVNLNSNATEDQAQLSGTHVLVEALAAEAAQLPEVRQEKVSSLRQAVQSGAYSPDPEQVAGALFSHLGVSSRGAAVETDWRASQEWAAAM